MTQVDAEGKFCWEKNSSGEFVPVFSFGKYKGEEVTRVAQEDMGYIDWMIRTADFSPSVMLIVIGVRSWRTKNIPVSDFIQWMKQTLGNAPLP